MSLIVASLAGALAPAFLAGHDPPSPAPGPFSPPTDENQPSLSIDLDLETATRYFFRGFRVIDDPIAQAQLDLSLDTGNTGPVHLTPYAGLRSLFAPSKYGDTGWKNLNEIVLTGGLELQWKKATLDLEYNLYTYPSDFSGRGQELGAILAFDDSDLAAKLYRLPLQPHLAYFFELEDRGDASRDAYLEVMGESGLLVSEFADHVRNGTDSGNDHDGGTSDP